MWSLTMRGLGMTWIESRRRSRRLLRYGNGVAALAVSAVVLVLLGVGLGSAPALGPALVPGHGAACRRDVDAARAHRTSAGDVHAPGRGVNQRRLRRQLVPGPRLRARQL